ncbi:hypothetical protein [Mucilaginibacter sp. UYCu711]|uniref:hypothetical protein n=1 Tax=Mucilaginibacter sp. UYCu711 TaxID=3156339 RepID=UPI003D1E7D1C
MSTRYKFHDQAMKSLVIFCLSLFGFFCSSSAQELIKKDTMYYLLDTLKIPINDRMITLAEQEGDGKFFLINCPCLSHDEKPQFYYRISKKISVSKKMFNSIKLISLTSLIEITKKSGNDFSNKYVFYMIEPDNKSYVMHQSYFIGRVDIEVDDSFIIKKQ